MTRASGDGAIPETRAEVRLIRPDELVALLDLYRHLHQSDEPLPSSEILEPLWQRILGDPGLRYLVAELDGRLVASCTLAIIPNLTRGARPYGLIENVVTHSELRRCGLGKAILERALQIAWDADCYKVMLLSAAHRSEAHHFYGAVGFDGDAKHGFLARPPARSQTAS